METEIIERAVARWTDPERRPLLLGDGTARVPLRHGLSAVIDADDAERVGLKLWYAVSHRRTHYALSSDYSLGKSCKTIRLHRFIIGAEAGQIVDHIDGDGLNNRRSNLRIVTASQNAINRRLGSSKGVYIHTQSGKWRAVIGHQRRKISLGLHADRESAIAAYNIKARELFGEHAVLNGEIA